MSKLKCLKLRMYERQTVSRNVINDPINKRRMDLC